MKKHIVLTLLFLISVFLDSAILPKWNLFHLVPFAMFAFMLASQHVFSIHTAIIVGALGGLFEDLLCENMIGLTSALCMLAAAAYEKMPRDSDTKAVILCVYSTLLAIAIDVLRALTALIIGMKFDLLNNIVYNMIPRAILTGIWTLCFISILKPLLKRQVDAA